MGVGGVKLRAAARLYLHYTQHRIHVLHTTWNGSLTSGCVGCIPTHSCKPSQPPSSLRSPHVIEM